MLIQLFSFLVLVLSTITWACTSNTQEIIDNLCSDPLRFTALINEALNTPEISSQLSSSSHAVLSSISSENEYTIPFYNFILENYDFHKLGFDSEDPHYWNALINYPFRDFARQHVEQAQVIINQKVLPRHPFLSQVPFTFETTKFLDQFIPDLDCFLDQVAKNIFVENFYQILALENPPDPLQSPSPQSKEYI